MVGLMDDKKIPGKRRRRCEICNHLKYGVERIINPFNQDVKGIEIIQAICPDCEDILLRDI
jgi:hypothetical protein